jgi:molybdenum cofactor biosynthesis enzyme MoaA
LDTKFEEIGLCYSLRCPSNCRICGTSSWPSHPETMAFNKAYDYIKQVSQVPSIKLIGFTGGEPFLFFRDISKLMEYARSLGLISKVATNAFWAKTAKIALTKLKQLKANGLEILAISADAYHQEFIPIERVMNAVRAGLDLNLILAITFIHGPNHEREFQQMVKFFIKQGLGDRLLFLRNLDDLQRHFLGARFFRIRDIFRSRIYLRESTVLLAGRARRARDECLFFEVDELPRNACLQAGRIMLILPSGRLLWCCSPVAFDDDSFLAGDLNTNNLGDLARRIGEDPVVEYLRVYGPWHMMKTLKSAGYDFDTHFSGDCHLCAHMLATLGRERIVKALGGVNRFETWLLKAIQDRAFGV